jgi:hypothetical protein
MAERDVKATVIGRRYDCDTCGQEMIRVPNAPMLVSSPPQYVHRCENGHVKNLSRAYPGYDIFIGQEAAHG